jgi:hypothetical protein
LAREAGLYGGGGYGVSDGGREDEHEVQARFLVRQAAYTRRGRGGGAPKGTSWAVIGPRPHAHGARDADARQRMAKGARDRSAARPRTRCMVPWVFGGTKVARGPPRHFRSPYAGEHGRRRVAGTVATSLAREREPDARVLVLFHLRRFKNA